MCPQIDPGGVARAVWLVLAVSASASPPAFAVEKWNVGKYSLRLVHVAFCLEMLLFERKGMTAWTGILHDRRHKEHKLQNDGAQSRTIS